MNETRPNLPGSTIRSGKDGPQLIQSEGSRWTDEAEARFLDQLAASCNVTLSAKATGFSREAIYKRRRNDPGFAERWQAALEQGYARIEMLLVQRATETLEGQMPDPDTPLAEMGVRDAINILQLHRAAVKGEGRAPGWRARPRSLDEMRDSILAKLEAIAPSPILLAAGAGGGPLNADSPTPDPSRKREGETDEA